MLLARSKTWLIMLILSVVVYSIGGMSAMASTEISNLVLNKNELSMEVGSTAALTATAVYVNGNTENVTVKTDWNSGASDVAAVYAGSVTAKKEGSAVITATYMGKTVIVNVTVTKKVRSLIKDKQTIDLRQGQSEQIGLTAYYDDGTSEDVTAKAEWNIDNGSIATVVNGLVRGHSSGTGVITAKYNNQTVSVPVSVEIVKRVDAGKRQISLLLNDSEDVTLFATYPDGTVEDVSDKAEWESDDPEIADVIKGKVTGYGPGKTTIYAAYGTKVTSFQVEVDNAVKLDLNKQNLLIKRNSTEQLKLTATYANGSTEDISARATWSSSNEEVASVTGGKIIAKAIGEATITAKYGDKTVTAIVDVDVPRRLEVNPETLFLQTGQTGEIVLRATYADGSTETVTNDAQWSVSNTDIAFAAKGQVKAYKAGTATVTAAFGGKTATVRVSVDIPNLIAPNQKAVSFQVGQSEQMILKALYTDGRELDVTSQAEWTTQDASVAEVHQGMITGVGIGTTTVTAKYGTRTTTIEVSVGVLKSLTTTSEKTISLKKGEEKSVDLTATFTDKTTRTVTEDATWNSSDEKIVTVDAGVIRAVESGTATVTASFANKSVTISVKVDMAETLTASPAFLVMDLNETRTITLSAKDGNGGEIKVNDAAEWSTSNASILQVDKGVVKPLSRGKATVTAKYGGKTATISVEVGVVQSLEASKRFASLKSGQELQVQLTAVLSDGSKRDVTAEAQWKSGNYKTVDVSNGLLKATGSGKTNITASFGGKTVTIPVDVDSLKYLKTDIINIEMKVGATAKVKATATYEDLSEADVTIPALWKTSNIRVADVKDGVITATGKGKATITMTFANKTAKVYVTVQ